MQLMIATRELALCSPVQMFRQVTSRAKSRAPAGSYFVYRQIVPVRVFAWAFSRAAIRKGTL
jgi:hypothetical protein